MRPLKPSQVHRLISFAVQASRGIFTLVSEEKPLIGISACLLGAPVRFDGGHKHHPWLVKELSKWVSWQSVCPEMEMGLGTPRESLRLVRQVNQTHLIGNETGADWTALAISHSQRLINQLPDLDGFIFKKNSPSCGVEKVKIYSTSKTPISTGQGFFASAVLENRPEIPVIEEGRLSDPQQREHFVTRVFAFHRWKKVSPKVAEIQKFHQQYKLLLMAHSPGKYQLLGKIAANSLKLPVKKVSESYGKLFGEALLVPTSVKKRVNVLQHVWGYFKEEIPMKERSGFIEIIEDYRNEELTFIAALTCLKQLLNRVSIPYLESQFFFAPYPKKIRMSQYL